jgi:hypothetical protein
LDKTSGAKINVVLVNPNKPQELIDKVLYFIHNAEIVKKMGVASKKTC